MMKKFDKFEKIYQVTAKWEKKIKKINYEPYICHNKVLTLLVFQ